MMLISRKKLIIQYKCNPRMIYFRMIKIANPEKMSESKPITRKELPISMTLRRESRPVDFDSAKIVNPTKILD